MFFEKELVSCRILDVVELHQRDVNSSIRPRNYDALSFRFHADVLLRTEEETIHAGDDAICLIPSGVKYTRSGPKDELIAIHFHTTEIVDRSITVLQPEDPRPLREAFRRILTCWKSREKGYQYQCSAILYEILAHCHRQTVREETADQRLMRSAAYLERHWNDPDLTIGEAAEQSFVSEVYFRKLFKEKYGMSPKKYLVQLRMQEAVSLMHAGYYSLKEVAALCGYRDYKYFSVEFKRMKGCSPSVYQYHYRPADGLPPVEEQGCVSCRQPGRTPSARLPEK